MWEAFKAANYWYLLPILVVVFFSHYLRAWRWRYLLIPIRRLDNNSLFSALMIGYGANTIMPAHLGEFLRAYVLAKKQAMPMSPVFATIVMERIIDVFSLLILMLIALFLFPFPAWAAKSGYIMLAGMIGLIIFLFFLKKATSPTIKLLLFVLRSFPEKFGYKIETIIKNFLAGIVPLRRRYDYIIAGVLSFAIWSCYGVVFFLCLQAFNFTTVYHLTWMTSLILLVITTIAVVVPSSPGYVGTYHYLCQISLAMVGVPAGPALSFATVVHGVNFFPVLIAGLFFAQREGTAIFKMSKHISEIEKQVPQEMG